MRIRSQYILYFVILFALVLALGAFSLYQNESIWLQTQGLYNHPFTVSRTLATISEDVLAMHRAVKDFTITESQPFRQELTHEIERSDDEVIEAIEVLYDRYLGPKADVDDLHESFISWRAIRKEITSLADSGERQEAIVSTLPSGNGGAKVDELMGILDRIQSFADNKAGEFISEAEQNRDSLRRSLIAYLIAAVLLLALIVYLLIRNTLVPLQSMTETARKFGEGDYSVRSPYSSKSELGELSRTLNIMAGNIEGDIALKDAASGLIAEVVASDEPYEFFRDCAKALARATGSQVAALFVLNVTSGEFEHKASVGYLPEGRIAYKASQLEGELGFAMLDGDVKLVRLPAGDAPFIYRSAVGDIRPSELINIPLISGEEELGFITLARTDSYGEGDLKLLSAVQDVLASKLSSILSAIRAKEFADMLKRSNYELEIQAREIETQSNELIRQNTELETQKVKLDEANRHKSVFLSNMSHELRTPLNSIISLSSVLSRRFKDRMPRQEAEYIETIERNGKHLLDVINDVLDLSRIEAGKEVVQLEKVDLNFLAEEAVKMLEPQAREKQVPLVCETDPGLPLATADETKVRHILINLIGNAIKFTEKGIIRVTTFEDGDDLCVGVTDTGIGIPEEHLEDIFDEFKQADESNTRKRGGTGLGLAISRKYAELMGAAITVRSKVGAGSSFTLRIAKGGSTDAVIAEAKKPERGANQIDRRGMRLLLVEDSEPAIVQMQDILSEAGFITEVARDGRQALERIAAARPDGMILDLMMPEVDGFEVLRQVRGLEETAGLPVLILTAKQVSKQELSFLKGNNISQLIEKGDVSKDELLTALDRMLAHKGK